MKDAISRQEGARDALRRGDTSKIAQPVVRRLSLSVLIIFRGPPDIPIPPLIGFVAAHLRPLKPFMLITSMINY